jgi:hypothetical protein
LSAIFFLPFEFCTYTAKKLSGIDICIAILGNVTNVMLFFRSKGVATPLLRKNRKKKTLHLQHYPILFPVKL